MKSSRWAKATTPGNQTSDEQSRTTGSDEGASSASSWNDSASGGCATSTDTPVHFYVLKSVTPSAEHHTGRHNDRGEQHLGNNVVRPLGLALLVPLGAHARFQKVVVRLHTFLGDCTTTAAVRRNCDACAARRVALLGLTQTGVVFA